MSQRIIIDLKQPLRTFSQSLEYKLRVPEYVLSEVVNLVFDVLIFEMEDVHEEPELHRLGNFYRSELEPDPIFMKRFLESFFELLRSIAAQLRGHGLYSGDGFEFAPEKNCNNRSIVVKKFETELRKR